MHPGSGIEKISSEADRAAGIRIQKKTSNKNAFSPSVNYLPIFFHIAGRRRAGLPEDWEAVERWATDTPPFFTAFTPEKKSSNEQKINSTKMSSKFWREFPKRSLPSKPTTKVKIKALEKMIKKHKGTWTEEEKTKARMAIDSLKNGAPAHQVNHLPAMKQKNAPSAYENADKFTEALSGWVSDGVVAGPFKSPPVSEFRANCLMAVVRKEKVRPVVNLSSPKNKSFNSNVDKPAVTKVRMASAAQVGQSILAAGKGSRLTKMDMKDAYKLVPARVEDFRLQGFEWLGRLFIDTQQVFGAATAAANFDALASTVLKLVEGEMGSTDAVFHRTLDDAACVAPAGSAAARDFAAVYRRIADEINIQLAPECEEKEKAFTDSTWGTVLGIVFDTEILCWRMPQHKVEELLVDAGNFIKAGAVCLEETQKLAGKINHLAQMLTFLKAFRRPLNDLLGEFGEDEDILLPVSSQLVADLNLCANAALAAMNWLPIPVEDEAPPLDAWKFVSDAAGGLSADEWAGVASVGLTESGKGVWFLARGIWPSSVYNAKDEKGARMAAKMTTLESVGLLLPFLSVPEVLAGQHVVLGVDNIGVVFGWENGGCKGDAWASSLIRALHVVAAYLGCTVYVRHVPRMSSAAAIMADSLTRSSTATAAVWAQAAGAATYSEPQPLWEWLREPREDFMLGFKLVSYLKNRME
jgi:hypothetical protein